MTWKAALRATTILIACGFTPAIAFAGSPQGSTCSQATDCTSTFCVDAVCCNQACTGGCGTCAAPGISGTCTPVASGNPGVNQVCVSAGGPGIYCNGADLTCPTSCEADVDCPSSEFCNASRSCQVQVPQGGACNLQVDCATMECIECTAGNTCGIATCDSDAGKTTVTATNKAGTCIPTVVFESQTCGGFGCDGTQCKTTCASDTDCATGSSCNAQTHVCVTGPTCSADRTMVVSNTNQSTSCVPYACVGGACMAVCGNDQECATGYSCQSGRCAVASDGGVVVTSSSACSVSNVREGSSDASFGAAIGLAMIVFAQRRRDRIS
jgi:hypothetical protein